MATKNECRKSIWTLNCGKFLLHNRHFAWLALVNVVQIKPNNGILTDLWQSVGNGRDEKRSEIGHWWVSTATNFNSIERWPLEKCIWSTSTSRKVQFFVKIDGLRWPLHFCSWTTVDAVDVHFYGAIHHAQNNIDKKLVWDWQKNKRELIEICHHFRI